LQVLSIVFKESWHILQTQQSGFTSALSWWAINNVAAGITAKGF